MPQTKEEITTSDVWHVDLSQGYNPSGLAWEVFAPPEGTTTRVDGGRLEVGSAGTASLRYTAQFPDAPKSYSYVAGFTSSSEGHQENTETGTRRELFRRYTPLKADGDGQEDRAKELLQSLAAEGADVELADAGMDAALQSGALGALADFVVVARPDSRPPPPEHPA